MAKVYDAGGQESYLDLAGASSRAVAAADAKYQAALAAQGVPQAQIAAMLASAKASATASQVGRDSLASPRETAQALFESKGQGQGAGEALQPTTTAAPVLRDTLYMVEEVQQLPADIISSGIIFNYTTTGDMAINPSNYRAFARAFNFDKGDTPILAGQRRIVGRPTLLPSTPPAAGLNGTNTFSWTGQAWAGQTRYSYFNASSEYVSPIVGSQVGYEPSNVTNNGIGIDLWINFDFTLPKLWNCTLFYYDSAFTGGILRSTKLCTNNVFEYKTINDIFGSPIIITNQKPIRSDDINYNAGYSNLQLYFTIYGALSIQPAGFQAVPATILQFNPNIRESWPRLLWTCA